MTQHQFDSDGVCTKCGLDGAEAYHLRQVLKAEIGEDEYHYRIREGEFNYELECRISLEKDP